MNKNFLITTFIHIFLIAYSDEIKIVNSDIGLVMRKESNVKSEKILTIPFNSKVTVIDKNGPEQTISGVKGKWFSVKYNNQEGWVFSGFLEDINNAYDYFNDWFAFSFAENILYENNDLTSNQILEINPSNYFQVLRQSKEEKNNKFWFLIKLPDNRTGWINRSGFISYLSDSEYKDIIEKFNILENEITEIKIEKKPKKSISDNLIRNTIWGSETNRFGVFIKFYNDHTYFVNDTSSGGVPTGWGIWRIKNDILITLAYNDNNSDPFSKKQLIWTYETDKESLYYNDRISDNLGNNYYNINSIVKENTTFNIDGIKSYSLHRNATAKENLSLLDKPDESAIIKSFPIYYDEMKEIFEKGYRFIILAYTIKNNRKWYYVDAMIDTWLSPMNLGYGWIKEDKIDLE